MTATNEGGPNQGSPPIPCDFCGRTTADAGPMIEGKALVDAGIRPHDHPHLLRLRRDLRRHLRQARAEERPPDKVPTPRELVAHLDEYIIGQDRVKKTLSVAVVNHYKRVLGGEIDDPALKDVEVAKSNVLLIGPTGCGKTALAQTLARRLHVPFAIGDATTLTEAGYVGEDVENLILKLVMAADYDIAARRAGDHLHRRDRQDRQDQPERLDHPRRLGRGGPAGPPEAPRGDRRQRPPRRGAQAPRAAVPPGRHDEHPLHLRRDVRRPGGDHRQAAGPEADRLRPRRATRPSGNASATRSWPRSPPRTWSGSA